ncbi:virulence protein [Enterobacter cloacae]|uniref:SpvB/TcaC N-terminal domain-containing protein n=1 Tax=Enterobacter cloacae TaxID=550 RepID=UPI0020036C53|nr:SpvB/TcaC N-terminal domain-containing protein [Enterobacter cloacae]MCK7318538.1 virulence protein [Enterobacter cloacae]
MSDTVPAQSAIYTPPTLPKGGGVISAGSGMLSAGGSDGSAGWSIPLPVFLPPARSLAPVPALVYSSNTGNSEFGVGWQLPVATIRRDTRFGVPFYTDDDRLTGPGGSTLLPVGDSRSASELPFGSGSRRSYHVTTWYEKNTGPAVRFEQWRAVASADFSDEFTFWIQYSPDGSLSLFGYSQTARLAPVNQPRQVAEWFLEESVTPRGEHILWSWRNEDQKDCSETELLNHPDTVNIYLTKISWANVSAAKHFLLPAEQAGSTEWLCFMVFDYGERNTPEDQIPPADGGKDWLIRPDVFSHWRYGFEVRTRRLCQEILLYHNKKMMESADDVDFNLVSRVRLNHETSSALSWLSSVQQMAYEEDGTVLKMPPTEFNLSPPAELPVADNWVRQTDLDGFCPNDWQMADLYGEGLPGLLYQDAGAWWYRAPQRSSDGLPDGVTWGEARCLSQAPYSRSRGRLTDLDANGLLEWVVTEPGLNGSFTLSSDGRWSSFIPFSAIPTEMMNEHALLADLTGGGLQDLVMIGPRSVRVWPGRGAEGWGRAETVPVSGNSSLPVGQSRERLVAFSDIPGGGQAHLVEISASSVTCWPSLGRGHFGKPFSLNGFSVSPESFSPDRVWLADIDGSGFTDILYLEQGGIRVFVNQSGNAFLDAGLIPPPEGLVPDDTWHLQVADFQGLGTASLLLTVPHIPPRSWLLNLNKEKPWLLKEISNNMGGRTLLEYRSSAQGWLDEKAALLAAGQPAISYLPFPVHTLRQVTQISDITGRRTGSQTRYLKGVWDASEREFCGFCRLIQTDTYDDTDTDPGTLSPPLEMRTWFLTGLEQHDTTTEGAFDGAAGFPSRAMYLTHRKTDQQTDQPYNPDTEEKAWLWRALRGMPVRTEVYGLDNSDRAALPFSISHQRWQVRAIAINEFGKPVTLATPVETLSLDCERIPSDPVITQSVILRQDVYGNILESVDINYPRQAIVNEDEYPDTLPEGLLAACRDPQQEDVWLTLTRNTVHNLEQLPVHAMGLPDTLRTDILKLSRGQIPEDGFSVESLSAPDSVLNDLESAVLGTWAKTIWLGSDGETVSNTPGREALVACTETALLDEASLTAFNGALSEDELTELLLRGGYHSRTLPVDGKRVWTGRHNLSTYLGESAFWLPHTVRNSELTGVTALSYTSRYLGISSVTDPAGLTTTFEKYDWRFMAPVRLRDVNDNCHYATFNAMGSVTQTRFRGTEFSVAENRVVETGYSPPETHLFIPPEDVATALRLHNIPVAEAHTEVTDSWMPLRRDEQGSPLPGQRTGELALRRWLKAHDLPEPDLSQERLPPHVISIKTDRYDNDPEQQVRISVTFSDGAGHSLQSSVLTPPGDAFIRTEAGGLLADDQGKAITAQAEVRWAVSGKTEYDNKGQPVRVWQPFFLNDWRPVSDDSARDGIYADTHFYDAPGREFRVVTAAGYERRMQFYPWFTVAEDENDTAQDVLAQRAAKEALL